MIARQPIIFGSGVYLIKCIPTGKTYVGSSNNIHNRWIIHQADLRNEKHDNHFMQEDCGKYGVESFELHLLESVTDLDKLIEREQYYIDLLNPDYNIHRFAGSAKGYKNPNGNGWLGRKHTEETKHKISEAQKGEKNHRYGKPPVIYEGTGKKISEALKGEKNPNYGKHLSDDTKQKLSKANKGSNNPMYGKPSPIKGTKRSDETKQKISEARKGNKNPMYGKPITDEHRQKLKDAWQKRKGGLM